MSHVKESKPKLKCEECDYTTTDENNLNRHKQMEQAGAELGQAQLPTGILLYCD